MIKRHIRIPIYIFFLAVAVSLVYGCGGGTDGGGNWSATSDKMTITGKISENLAIASPASVFSAAQPAASGPGMAASKFPIVYLKDNDKKTLIDSAVPSADGTFSFYGDFRGLLLSFYIGNTSNEILLGRVDPGMPLKSQINVSLPYNAAGGFDENAVIATNIIKSQGLTSEIFITSSGVPGLWSLIEKTKTSVNTYLSVNPGKVISDILKESADPASASIVEIIKNIDFPKPPAAVLDRFEVSPVSASITAGDTISLTLKARGTDDSLIKDFAGIASISSTTGAGTFSPPETPGFSAGECLVGDLCVTKAQPKVRLTFSSGGKYGYTNEFDVTPGRISFYTVNVGSVQNANQGFYGTVTAFDKFGNIAANDSSTFLSISFNVATDSVIFYSDANYSQAISAPYNYRLNNGKAEFFMKSLKTQRIVLDFSDNSNVKVSSPAINAGSQSVSSYEMSVGTAQLAGNGFQGVITARDSRGDIASADNITEFTLTTTASTDSVSFYSDALYAIEMPSKPSYRMESGVLKFYMKSKIPQSFVILASAVPDKNISSGLITCGPVMASSYEMQVAAEQTAGVEFSGVITAEDSSGRVIDTDNSTNLTLTVTGGSGITFYSDNTYSTLVQQPAKYVLKSGSAAFYARSDRAQEIKIISVDDFGRTVKSPNIRINPSHTVGYSLNINGSPTADGFSGTARALDAYGNIVTTDSSTEITLSVFSGTISAIAFYRDPSFLSKFESDAGYVLTRGQADFYVRNDKVEQMSLLVSDNVGKSGTSEVLTVGHGSFDHFNVSTDSPQSSGRPVNLTVEAMDRSGNIVTDFKSSGTLKIDSPSGGIIWNGPGVVGVEGNDGLYNGETAFSNGSATISVTNSRADQLKTVTITDTLTGKTAAVKISWISGSFHHFSISKMPGQCIAGETVAVEIKALDSSGNVDPYFNNVNASISDLTATVSPSVTGVFISGVWTGEITFTKALDINSLTVTAASKNSTSNAFKVKHSSIKKYVVNAVSPQVAGVGINNTIVAKDAYGNTVISDSSTIVNITSTAVMASFYTGADYNTTTSSCSLLSGVANYYFKDTRSEKFRINVYDSAGNTGVSPEIAMNPAAISNYVITSVSSQTAGTGFSGTITAKDFYGNVATNDNSTIVKMSHNGAGVTFYTSANCVAPTTSYHLSSGSVSYYVKDIRDETFEITVNDDNHKSGKTAPIKINHGPTSRYLISSVSPQTSGVGFTNIITAKDAFNNTVINDSTTTVNVTSSGSALAFFTTSEYAATTSGYRLTSGVASYFARDTKSEIVNIAASDSNGKIGVSSDIYITPAPIVSYIVSSFTPKIAGNGFSGIITAKDAFNNTAVTDSSTVVDVISTGHGVTFYSDATYSTPVLSYRLTSGVATYYVKNTVAETFYIIVKDSNNKVGTTNDITITPSTLVGYLITSVSPQTAGIGNAGTITAKDLYNNTITYDNSTVVNLTSNGTGVTFYSDQNYITPASSFTLSSGVTSYYVKNTKAEIYKITVTDASGKTGVSGNITILPASIAYYKIASDSPHAANQGFSNTITACDAFDNIAVNDNTTFVVMGSSGTGVSFYTDSSYALITGFYTLSAGVATYYVKNAVSETFKVTVTDTTGKTGASVPISMLPGAVSKYKIGVITPQTVGIGFAVTISAQDSNNNIVVGDSTTSVSVSSTGTAVNFYADDTYTTLKNDFTLTAGVTTCYLKNTKSESFTVSASDVTGHTGVSSPISVVHAQIASYSVLPVPNKEAGALFANSITALDVFGNVAVTDFSTVVNMATTATGLNFYTDNLKTTTTTTYQLSGGSVVYYATNTKAETFTITATDSLFKTGTSSNIIVYPSQVQSYQITSPALSPNAGTDFTGTITGHDAYGNMVLNDSITSFNVTSVPANVSFYLSDGITPTGSYTLTSGTVNYYARCNVAGAVTISITDFFGRSGLSPSFVVNPGPISGYSVDSSPSQVAGLGYANIITAKDAYGNIVTADSSTVVGVSSSGSGVAFYADGGYSAPVFSYTLNLGIATYYVKNTVAETFTISALDGSGKSGVSNNIIVNPGAISGYVVSSTSPMSVAGGGISNIITAKDAYNNTVSTDNSTVVTVSAPLSAGALFYTDSSYLVNTGNYTLNSGQATYYLKDAIAGETFKVEVTDTTKTGSSADITTIP